MAHFAEIWTGLTVSGETPQHNEVIRVLVIPQSQEHRGHEYLSVDLDLGGTWIQTSYNGTIRKNFAGIGMFYDDVNDLFRHPQPYPSWTLNTDDGLWYSPTPYPGGTDKMWDEDTLSWVEIP